jgi:hypothetical protein
MKKCIGWSELSLVFDESWYPGTSVSPCQYRSTIDPYSYYICMQSMMYNLKNNNVVQLKKTSNWFARYAIVGQSRHVVVSFLLLGGKKKSAVDTRTCEVR